MKTFYITKPSSFGATHPQEDFLFFSNKYPIFVVADGVALNCAKASDYPKHSGAFDAAEIFCKAVILEAEKRCQGFKDQDLKEIFKLGNKAVANYNISQDRTKDTTNYYDFDLFSATTSFLLIKDKKAYWWSLCDAGITLFNKQGKRVFISPDGWIHFPKNWTEGKNDKEKIIERHRDYRNAVSKAGELTGYGAVDGEDSAKLYLESGVLDLNAGDLIFAYTDGFENYFLLDEFIDIFKYWPTDLEAKLNNIISEESKLDPKKYGAEKTLIAISI